MQKRLKNLDIKKKRLLFKNKKFRLLNLKPKKRIHFKSSFYKSKKTFVKLDPFIGIAALIKRRPNLFGSKEDKRKLFEKIQFYFLKYKEKKKKWSVFFTFVLKNRILYFKKRYNENQMLKLYPKIKNSTIFYLLKRYKRTTKKKRKYLRRLRIHKIRKRISNFYNRTKWSSIFSSQLNIKITSNNIFCILKNTKKNKTIISTTAGKYKIKTTKKRKKYATLCVMRIFFGKIKKYIPYKNLIINVCAPIRFRRRFVKSFIKFFKNFKLIINYDYLTCFNGCRPKKKRRKKRKGFRLFR